MQKSQREVFYIEQPDESIRNDIMSILSRYGVTLFVLIRDNLFFKRPGEDSLVAALRVLKRDHPDVTVKKYALANKDIFPEQK